jgi:branched-chain amino acid aminotransferase
MSRLLLPFWFGGALRNESVFPLSPSDRGFLLGDGAFETLAVFSGTPIDLGDHVSRLMRASTALGLGLVQSDISQAILTLTKRHEGASGIMRITVSRGAAARGLAADASEPTLLITLSAWTPGTLFQPVTLLTSSVRRNASSPASGLKLTSYADNILAAREAHAAGADDALMLNEKGTVACTTISNIFAIHEGRLFTPPEKDGALPGIVRHYIDSREETMLPHMLHEAEGVFLTNSVRVVRPVISLDGVSLSTAARQKIVSIFEEQCLRIREQCGIDPRAIDKG